MAIIDERPTIIVNRHESLSELNIAEILLGIEEESLPYTVHVKTESNAAELAHAAAIESRLGVGVGASGDTVVVTTEKLPADTPYIVEPLNVRRAVDRAVGLNAARLVKRMPLHIVGNGA
ncbi:MAG: glycerol dehydratase reactivase beta/small subunit family protein [Propionibacteriaceae bacterium]|jgi:hypothetical protein|nr:glycerol dehydratase reactivase beta/small subunit family protein [Propionibacteriaceae bacterium]